VIDSIKKILFTGSLKDQYLSELIVDLSKTLNDENIELYCFSQSNDQIDIPNVKTIEEQSISDMDLIVSIGGDGTMLQSSKLASNYSVPITGINKGRLGFLTDINPELVSEALQEIINGEYQVESRMLLDVKILNDENERFIGHAINDLVINKTKTGRMINVRTSINGKYVNSNEGDGYIVSTPTGSTAYSLSCGGPIINPNSDTFLLVPIAPHTLTNRPMVIPSGSIIKLEFTEENDDTIEISLDGEIISEISGGDCIMISRSKNTVKFIHPKQYDYYETLRSKLFWGHDQRNA
jgi:NAD+ kinase|tara:strand:+ start:397 stop:1281 length:885 start_codon:yes stop_codon:yes gene_type:complete